MTRPKLSTPYKKWDNNGEWKLVDDDDFTDDIVVMRNQATGEEFPVDLEYFSVFFQEKA